MQCVVIDNSLVCVAMLVFCPTCASALIVEEGPSYLRFGCFCCPYVHNIRHVIVSRVYPQLKVRLCSFLMHENILCILTSGLANLLISSNIADFVESERQLLAFLTL